VLDLDNDLTAITHDEGEEGIDNINDNGDGSDNGNAHEEIVEKHAVAATELVEEGIKEGQKENEVAPPLEENNEVREGCPAANVSKYNVVVNSRGISRFSNTRIEKTRTSNEKQC
jgi:hypothetical protein